MKKPVIGITAVTAFNDRLHAQRITYPNAVWAAGGEAIFLPCNSNTDNVEQIVNMLDGLLVPGGADIDPQLYGEEVLPVCGAYIRSEDDYDIALIKETIRQGKPILATCRGMQQVQEISDASIMKQLALDESEWSDIVAEMRKDNQALRKERDSYKEINRILLQENLDLKDYFEDEGINPGIEYKNLKDLYSVFANKDEPEISVDTEEFDDEPDTNSVL